MNFDPITRDYPSDAHKLLSDNRAAYIAQSAATRFGEVAPFTPARQSTAPLPVAGGAGIYTNDPALPGKE